MKVEDLLAKPSDFDLEHDVVFCCEDEAMLAPGDRSRLLDVIEVTVINAKKTSGKDGMPLLRLGDTEFCSPHVLIELTTDF